jgi:hypothetical protein
MTGWSRSKRYNDRCLSVEQKVSDVDKEVAVRVPGAGGRTVTEKVAVAKAHGRGYAGKACVGNTYGKAGRR